jgi:flavin reductase (DIM6/NTAB) family NADH-FMN oxidoreductase RutF
MGDAAIPSGVWLDLYDEKVVLINEASAWLECKRHALTTDCDNVSPSASVE